MQLYVGGLSDDTTEVDIEEVFSGTCRPQLVTIIRDIESGRFGGAFAVTVQADFSSRQVCHPGSNSPRRNLVGLSPGAEHLAEVTGLICHGIFPFLTLRK
jgi:hypothetical protein